MAISRLRNSSLKKDIQVLLDTSSLMAPFQTGVDLIDAAKKLLSEKIGFVVVDETLKELNILCQDKKPSVRKAALSAKKLVDGIKVIQTNGCYGDDAIINVAKKGNTIVATTDSNLRKRLRLLGISVIFLKSGKRPVIEGGIEIS